MGAKEILGSLGLHAKKSFGQNFLHDVHHLRTIAHLAVCLRQNDHEIVYELGAGLGALTRALLDEGALVHAIERDRDLVPILRREFAHDLENKKLTIHEANASTFNFGCERFVLCGNLPYHLTSTLMLQAADWYTQLDGAVYMIQAEVAERIAAAAGSKTYGLLSVLMQVRFNVAVVHHVPREAFWPIPQIDSSVIQLTPRQSETVDWSKLKHLVKTAFAYRRKTLRNSLSRLPSALEALEQIGLDPILRAENLSPEDYVRLCEAMK